MRVFYLLFLPAWILIAASMYLASRAQGVFLAYLLFPATNLAEATRRINSDIRCQLTFLQVGLLLFLPWLMAYLMWWTSHRVERES